MIAISDDERLYLLEFIDSSNVEHKMQRLRAKTKLEIVPGSAEPLDSITLELQSYFHDTLTEFKTPLLLFGSPFQKRVWDTLTRIPYGQTKTYAYQAKALGNPAAYRAVANANGSNQFAIVIPCHRIIRRNGDLGGYAGGIRRKQWLLDHEKKGQ